MVQDKKELDCRTSPISSFGTGSISSLPSLPASWNHPGRLWHGTNVRERNRKKYRGKKYTEKTKHWQHQVFVVQSSFANNVQLSERRLICQFAEPSLTSGTIRERGTDARTIHPPSSFRFFSFLLQLSFIGMDASELNESWTSWSKRSIEFYIHIRNGFNQWPSVTFTYFEQLQRRVLVPVILHYDMLLQAWVRCKITQLP